MPDYKVTVEGSDPIPVRAPTRQAAINHAIRLRVTATPLSTEDAIAFGARGVGLVIAGEEPAPQREAADGDAGDPKGGETE